MFHPSPFFMATIEQHPSILNSMVMEKIERSDYLLTLVLVRLPPKSLFRFRCVSRRWNNIVTNHFFIQSYEARKRQELLSLKGLLAFIETKTYVIFRENWYSDCPQDDCTYIDTVMRILPLSLTNDRKLKMVPRRFGYFIHSSNGLVLCSQHRYEYHVLNPVARTWVSLPPPPIVYHTTSMGLACEENTRSLVPNYKVVQAGVPPLMEVKMPIQTYSSRTRTWRHSTLVGTGRFKVNSFMPPLVFNGVFHWFLWHAGLAIAVYDSKRDNDNHIQLIILPYNDQMIYDSGTVTRSFSDDVLWYGVEVKDVCSQFWMLPKDQRNGYRRSMTIPDKDWVLMHTISHDPLRKELVWLIPGNPIVVVLRIQKRIYLYNLETKSIESVLPVDRRIVDLEQIFYYSDFYMEPLSLSSYALSANTY